MQQPTQLDSLPLDVWKHIQPDLAACRKLNISKKMCEIVQEVQPDDRLLQVEITPVVTMASADAQPQISLLGVPDLKAIDADIRKQAARLKAQGCHCMKLHLRISVPSAKQERYAVPPAAYEQQRQAFTSVFACLKRWVAGNLLTVVSFSCRGSVPMDLQDAFPLFCRIQDTIKYLCLEDLSSTYTNIMPPAYIFISQNQNFRAPLLRKARISFKFRPNEDHTNMTGTLDKLVRTCPELQTLALQGRSDIISRCFVAATKDFLTQAQCRLKRLHLTGQYQNLGVWKHVLETQILQLVDIFHWVAVGEGLHEWFTKVVDPTQVWLDFNCANPSSPHHSKQVVLELYLATSDHPPSAAILSQMQAEAPKKNTKNLTLLITCERVLSPSEEAEQEQELLHSLQQSTNAPTYQGLLQCALS
jgi:hypothetical protein